LKNPLPASPFTVDFLEELRLKFKETITDKLDARSKEALLTQEDPASMRDIERLRIQRSILHMVYGKKINDLYFKDSVADPGSGAFLTPGSGIRNRF
jgi:hypothetical protein